MNTTTHPHHAKTPRPLILSIVGWWLVATGAMSIYGLTAALSPVVQSTWASLGVSPAVAVALTLISGAAHAAAGFGILKGFLWGRTLYLAFGALSLVSSAFLFHTAFPMLLFGFVVYGVFAFILTRESANDYFAGTYEVPPVDRQRRHALALLRAEQRNQSDLKRVFGVLFAVGGGFLLGMALFMFGFASGGVAAFLAAFFGLPALVATAIGVLLWGRSRWAGLSGWTLAAVGAWTVFTGITVLIMMQTEIWDAAMAQAGAGAEFGSSAFVVVSLLGALVGLAGAGLLYRQREADDEAVQLLLGQEAEGEL